MTCSARTVSVLTKTSHNGEFKVVGMCGASMYLGSFDERENKVRLGRVAEMLSNRLRSSGAPPRPGATRASIRAETFKTMKSASAERGKNSRVGIANEWRNAPKMAI